MIVQIWTKIPMLSFFGPNTHNSSNSRVPQWVTGTGNQETFPYPLYPSGMDSFPFRCPWVKI